MSPLTHPVVVLLLLFDRLRPLKLSLISQHPCMLRLGHFRDKVTPSRGADHGPEWGSREGPFPSEASEFWYGDHSCSGLYQGS